MVQNNAKGTISFRYSLFCSDQITKFGQFSLTFLYIQCIQPKLLSGSGERYWWLSQLFLFSMIHTKTVSKFHSHYNESGTHKKQSITDRLCSSYKLKWITVLNDVKTCTVTPIMTSQLFSDSLGRLISNREGWSPLIPDWCIWPDFWWP